MNPKLLFNFNELNWILERISIEIIERNRGVDNLAIIGVRTRGEFIARRLQKIVSRITGQLLNVGIIDITLYRDDLSIGTHTPCIKSTDIDFTIDEKIIILVDDVIYTGRSVRAAIDAIFDIGRPKSIQLAVLVDRGHRELPIQPDFVGKVIPTSRRERIFVKLSEIDSTDQILIGEV